MDSTSQQSTPRIEDSNVHDPGKMFVGGLSWNTTSDTLKEYFCKFGEVRECMIMRDPESKRSRGFGFVTFVDPLSVDQVLQSGDHRVDDKKVDPKKAIPKKAQVKPVTRTKKMFIGGLSQQTTVEDLKAYFAKYGQVEEASLMIDKNTKRSRGFGFIVFESEDIVDKVTEDHFHEVNNKMVETKKAQPKEVMQPHQNAKAKALMRGLCSSFYGFPYPAPLFIDQPGLKVNPSPFHQAGFHQLPRGAAYACAPVSPYVAGFGALPFPTAYQSSASRGSGRGGRGPHFGPSVAVNGFAQGFAASPSQVNSRGYGTGSSPGPLDIYGSTTTQGDQNSLTGTGGYIQATSPQPSSYGIGAQAPLTITHTFHNGFYH
ncbi:RNA-binding protein Musashi homolog 2-like isoform X2 [Apostichopus japonicus]|uniref:RNA-binding protein Musashi homolog 2-like isoform X2 n=1 Tax=Stichopus japonicus TaxID=307972 RepID=UPI003AB37700